jgi:hypothetical protein
VIIGRDRRTYQGMKGLTASELLEVWEQGHAAPIFQRSLMLLAAACTDIGTDDLCSMSMGKCDATLLDLRDLTFGSIINCLESCPGCKDPLELSLRTLDLKTESCDLPENSFSIMSEEYEIKFRLPNSRDLFSISACREIKEAKQMMLKRCITEIRRNGEICRIDIQLPNGSGEKISERMREIDPQAYVEVNLICPSCGFRWQRIFDVATFFWKEIDAWALRTLMEVHVLASAYGWSETEILSMSQWKRQVYLEMVGE